MQSLIVWKNTWPSCLENIWCSLIVSNSWALVLIGYVVSNLHGQAFTYTAEVFKDEQFKLMKKKGVYPYDNMDSFDKFNEKQLPKKENFHSILNNGHIYMSSQISFYYLMFSKILERLVCNLINRIHAIISLHMVWVGMQCWKWLELMTDII